MKQQKVICIIMLSCLILFSGFYTIFLTRTKPAHTIASDSACYNDQDTNGSELEQAPPESIKFLYSIQTECCLPAYLNTHDIIGSSVACQCDVLVLSFKQDCNNKPSAHVEYIFATHLSWNEGRNLLFEMAKKRSKKYLYYIFMDDDVQFTTQLNMNPWRAFEEFLLNIEPAVAVVDDTKRLNIAYKSRKELGCDEDDPDYVNAPQFDSAFNAFHYQAVNHILPYTTKFDNVSWWFSGWYAKVRCDVMFPGQTVMLTKISRVNLQHRNYPQFSPYLASDWEQLMKEVELSLPEKYRNVSLFLAWKKGGHRNQEKTISHCFPLPTPHMPIRPFAYLETEYNR